MTEASSEGPGVPVEGSNRRATDPRPHAEPHRPASGTARDDGLSHAHAIVMSLRTAARGNLLIASATVLLGVGCAPVQAEPVGPSPAGAAYVESPGNGSGGVE